MTTVNLVSQEGSHIHVQLSGGPSTLWRIERREAGSEEWVILERNTWEHRDYAAAHGATYYYRGRTGSGTTTTNELEAVLDIDKTYIHDPRDPGGSIYGFLYDGVGRSRGFHPHRQFTGYIETPLPSAEFGDFVESTRAVTLTMDENGREVYERFLHSRRPVIYRDKRGLLIHGFLQGDVVALRGDGWYSVNLTVVQTSQTLETV